MLDGPLGTAAADAHSPLLLPGGLKLPGAGCGARTALALREGARVVWECDSLAGASPALMAAVPVVHLGASLQVCERV